MRKSNSPISAQLVIPASFAECITYEKQILWLKKEIDSLSGGGDPEAIAELQRKVATLESNYSKLQKQIKDLPIDVIENELEVISGDIQMIKNSLDTKQDVLTFDDEPTAGSSNPVRSEGILEAIHNEGMRVEQLINGKVDEEVFNEAMRNIINNYVTNGDLTEALTAYAKLTDIADMATKTELADYATKTDIEDLVTDEELAAAIADLATKTELEGKQDKLTFDTTPVAGSTNPVTSGGIYEALQNVTPSGTVDDTVTEGSSNPVKSSGIYSFVKAEEENLATKEDIADFITEDDLAEYATKTDIADMATKTELVDYAKTEDLDEYAKLTDIADMATKTELAGYAKTSDIADMATKTELADYAKTEDLEAYATKSELGDYVRDEELAVELTNYATKAELGEKQDALTFDNTPVDNSMNPVTSDGIKKAIDAIPTVTVDNTVSQSSQNPVSSNGIYNFVVDQMGDLVTTDQLATKQDVLTFDDTPTAGSANPVKSSGIKSAIENATSGLVRQEQLGAYATNDSVEAKLATYATKSEISDMATKTELAGYATKEDISDMATKSEISDMATKTELAGYATKEDISDMATKEDISDMATKEDISDMATKTELADYATKEDIDNMATLDDLAPYETIQHAEATYATKTALGQKQNVLTFDNIPLAGSSNPVTSNGIFQAIQAASGGGKQLYEVPNIISSLGSYLFVTLNGDTSTLPSTYKAGTLQEEYKAYILSDTNKPTYINGVYILEGELIITLSMSFVAYTSGVVNYWGRIILPRISSGRLFSVTGKDYIMDVTPFHNDASRSPVLGIYNVFNPFYTKLWDTSNSNYIFYDFARVRLYDNQSYSVQATVTTHVRLLAFSDFTL